MASASPRTAPVCIPYERLLDQNADLSRELCAGFGPNGLGIVTVSGVPDFVERREELLPLAQAFADLPDEVKAAYEHAGSSYNVGWSHGKEALRSGMPDVHKGSFYANPMQDDYASVDAATSARYPEYFSPNVWPQQQLPQLEPAFKALGRLVVDVGLLLAGHCARYVQQQLSAAAGCELQPSTVAALDFEAQLRTSCCHKARLLHYFPVQQEQQQPAAAAGGAADHADNDWCGWHLDHGALTGLTSALFIKDGQVVPNPDPAAGLYICDRSGDVVQAAIPKDHIAYQMGQVMAIQSGGLLRATPHYVRAAGGAPGVSRNTFAVFMQPDTGMPLVAPPVTGASLGALLCLDSGHWAPGMTFGDFAERTLQGYYVAAPAAAAGGAGKDVAPAAVHAAAAAAGRRFASGRLELLVSHE